MTGRTLTDAQIARALRAHLPERAQSGLMDRVLAEAATTPQQRALPAFLGGFGDADPVVRRRYQLIAATLIVALALAVVAGVGALLRQKPDVLSLDPPTDVDAYVTEAYEGIADLPAFSITIVEVEGSKVHFAYNGTDVMRMDHYDMATATEPSMYRLFTRDTMAEEAMLGDELIWLEYNQPGHTLNEIVFSTGMNPSCEAGWAYVALEYLIERPTHHVDCDGLEMWLDVATGLPLRSVNPQAQTGGPVVEFRVIEFSVGPQPPELFVPPPEARVMSDLEFNCALDPTCVTPPTPMPTQPPVARPPAAPGDFTVPPDLEALVAESRRRYETLPALAATISDGDPMGAYTRVLHDGSGRFRWENVHDPSEPPVVELIIGGHFYESEGSTPDGRSIWRDWGPFGRSGLSDLGLSQPCVQGWEHRGFDLVLDRPAHHLVCGHRELWLDVEWLLATRGQTNPDPLHSETYVTEILELRFEQPSAELFELPEDALVCAQVGRDGICLDSSGNPVESPSPSP